MQGPKYLYAILNAAGQCASYENNTLVWNSVFTPLEMSPDGWQEMSILVEKNKEYFGLDITYGTPQNFVISAAAILKSVVYIWGIEFETFLQILERQTYFSDTEYGYYYDQLSRCEIDLSTYVDSGSVTTNILEGGIAKYIKANRSIDYAIDIDVPNRMRVAMDGIKLKESASFIISDPVTLDFNGAGNHIMGLEMLNNEQKTTLGAQTTTRMKEQSNALIPGTGDWILDLSDSTIPTVVTAIADMAVTVAAFPGSDLPFLPQFRYFMGFRVFNKATGALISYPDDSNLLFDSGPGLESGYGHKIIKTTISFIVPPGCIAFPVSFVNVTNDTYANGIQFTYDNNSLASSSTPNLILQYDYKFKGTFCYGLSANDLWKALIDKMTDGRYTGNSTLLENPDLNIVFTCGDALRQLIGSQIKISVDKFFTACNLIWGTGMGIIGSEARLERKRFFVTSTTGDTQLGDFNSRKIYPYTDCLFSSVKFGWPNQNYNVNLGDINGKYEICVTQIMSSPVTRVDTVLDLTTTVRADMYGQEFTRINLDGKTSTSDNADNDVFVQHVNNKPTEILSPITGLPFFTIWELDRTINKYVADNNVFVKEGDTYVISGVPFISTVSQYTQVGLLDKDTAFNVALSPKQCLIRGHGDYLHSCLEKMETKYLTFASSDKVSALAINNPIGYSTEENGNVQILTLDAPIFQPWVFEGTVINPPKLASQLVTSPIKTYSGNYAGIPVRGTSLKSGVMPTDNAPQDYQLLLAPEVDKTPFINEYE